MYRYQERQAQYVEAMKKETGQCPFCDLEGIKRSQQRRILEETQHAFVTENNFSYDIWEGLKVVEHLMIIPKRHISLLNELTSDERKDIIDLSCRYGSQDYDIYHRAPSSVIRSVTHVHLHLLKTTGKRANRIEATTEPYDLKVDW